MRRELLATSRAVLLCCCTTVALPGRLHAQALDGMISDAKGIGALRILLSRKKWKLATEVTPQQSLELAELNGQIRRVDFSRELDREIGPGWRRVHLVAKQDELAVKGLKRILLPEQFAAYSHLYVQHLFAYDRLSVFLDKQIIEFIKLPDEKRPPIEQAVNEFRKAESSWQIKQKRFQQVFSLVEPHQHRLFHNLLGPTWVPELGRGLKLTTAIPKDLPNLPQAFSFQTLGRAASGDPSLQLSKSTINALQEKLQEIKRRNREFAAEERRLHPLEYKPLEDRLNRESNEALLSALTDLDREKITRQYAQAMAQESLVSFFNTPAFTEYLELSAAQRRDIVTLAAVLDKEIKKLKSDYENQCYSKLTQMLPEPSRVAFIELVGDHLEDHEALFQF